VRALRIGEVAKQSDVGIETIRYYERQGLLAEPDRRPSGYRQYDGAVVARLQFIRRAKELGFTLAEIKELLGLWFDVNTKCVHVRQRAEQKITNIEDKIRSLQKMKRSLKKIISQCENRDAVDECPLWLGLDEPRMNKKAGNSASSKARKL
jgi:Hg(II)-responsive transcriptional regulator